MDWLNLFALAVALAMDAFAVALVTGLTLNPLPGRQLFRMSFHFGLFQALMPALGWVMGRAIYRYIHAFDHWVAFALLGFVGGRMFWGAIVKEKEDECKVPVDPTAGRELIILSVATSIDALAVGLSLATLGSGILVPTIIIGVVAAAFTLAGMLLGRRIGTFWGKRVEAAGGLILIAIGLRILIEHYMK